MGDRKKTEGERECEVGAFVILIRAPCRHIIDGHQCGDMSENRRAGRRCLNLNGQINCVCQACGQVLVPLEPRQQQQTQAAGQRINWFLDTGWNIFNLGLMPDRDCILVCTRAAISNSSQVSNWHWIMTGTVSVSLSLYLYLCAIAGPSNSH